MINYHTYHNSQLSILNSQLNKLQFTSCRGKLRRLWRLAVAPHPPIAETPISAVSRGDTYPSETHCKLRRSAAVGQASPHPLLVPQSGTDYYPKHHTGCISPPSGNYMWWRCRTYPQLRCFAACSGFHDIGPAPRNPQLKLNLLVVRGCVATAGRHSLLSL